MTIVKLTTHKAKKYYVCDYDQTMVKPGDTYLRGFCKTDLGWPFEFFLCNECLFEERHKQIITTKWLSEVYNRRKAEKAAYSVYTVNK